MWIFILVHGAKVQTVEESDPDISNYEEHLTFPLVRPKTAMDTGAIVWFRQDLRVHDNEALLDAIDKAKTVYPVYVFDDRVFKGKTTFGFPKTGRHRARFIYESVQNLQQQLQSLGADIIILTGHPEEELFNLARKLKVSWICCNRERTQEELLVQDQLEKHLWTIGVELRFSRGKMLFYTQDLPFPITHTPDTFALFRKEVERSIPIRSPLPVPKVIPYQQAMEGSNVLPEDPAYGAPISNTAESPVLFKGGETSGLARLNHFLWGSDAIASYKTTRNDLIGPDNTSRFSPWLSQGCLSPKLIYEELKSYEASRDSNESTYWLFFELLWRDYFRLVGKKYGNAIFRKEGLRTNPSPQWIEDEALFSAWSQGQTGVPIVDACMRELNATGYLSNRARQIVANFLVKDLSLNWQWGASYFESQLIDYDPCSNWCNWGYLAGVGTDSRDDRTFNVMAQAKKYDPHGEYIRKWIPELAPLPGTHIHCPERVDKMELAGFGVNKHVDYPQAIVALSKLT